MTDSGLADWLLNRGFYALLILVLVVLGLLLARNRKNRRRQPSADRQLAPLKAASRRHKRPRVRRP